MAWQFVRGWDWRWWTIWQSSRQQSRQTKTYIIVCFQPNFQGEPAVNGSTAGRYRHFQLGQTLSAHKSVAAKEDMHAGASQDKGKETLRATENPSHGTVTTESACTKRLQRHFGTPGCPAIPGLLKKAFPRVLLSRRQEDRRLLQSWFQVAHLQLTVVRDLVTLKWVWFCWHAELTRALRVQRKS